MKQYLLKRLLSLEQEATRRKEAWTNSDKLSIALREIREEDLIMLAKQMDLEASK